MTLRRVREAALYAGFGFLCDLASTGFCRAVASGLTLWAICCNLALMVLTLKMLRNFSDRGLMAAWIIGQSAGIWLAMKL